ncbi:MAG TPA: LytTR family DNA-binding domain-containing protein [Rudaea sp.]
MTSTDAKAAPLNVLVVDDEALARRNLTVLLHRDPQIAVVESASGHDAIDKIKTLRPDIVFLDVQMPECGGFDVLEMLGTDLPPVIIFVTAHDEYALRAFEAGALDYLLKPFDDARFARALSRAKDKLAHHASARRAAARVVIKEHGRVTFLDVADIDWIEAAGNYACLHVDSQTHILRRSLQELERDLGGEDFVRLHRSTIAKVDRIHGLELRSDGDYEVVLKSQVRLRLSRRYRRRVQERLMRRL